MKINKLLVFPCLIGITMALSGCAPEVALTLPEPEQGAFYKPNDVQSGKATLYLTCGKEFYNSWLRISSEGKRICQYKINGEIYKHIGPDGVGRLDVEPGTYFVKQVADAGTFNSNDGLALEMKAGEMAVCKADHSWYVGFAQGPATASHNYPIECEKNNVLVQIRNKEPVRMEAVQTTQP